MLSRDAQHDVRPVPEARALYFPSGERQLFGWLHQPAVAADLGIVLCKPFGYEALCSHRSVRALAKASAAMGVPALRFDYLGTGDSEDMPAGTNQITAWVEDILAAAGELQRRTGVRRVCLVGLRLGALLATLAATQSAQVSALVALAPVVSGRRYLRELRTMRLAASQRIGAASGPEKVEEAVRSAHAVEAGGFSLEADSVASLAATELSGLPARPAADVLILDRTDLPSARAWADALSAQQVRLHYETVPGFVQMMLTEPQLAVVPEQMIASVCGWLQGLLPPAPAGSRSSSVALPTADAVDPTTAALAVQSPDGPLIERPIYLAEEPQLFGIVTEPRGEETRRRAVILLNDGATHHVGSNRMGVELARRWARRGYLVLRMDLEGLGDSATRAGCVANDVFPQQAVSNIRAAVEYVHDQYDITDITLTGLCAGAYHCLRAAVAGLPITRILTVNLLNFYWEEDIRTSELEMAEVIQNARRYRRHALSANTFRRLLSGRANFPRIARIVTQRGWMGLGTVWREAFGYLRSPRTEQRAVKRDAADTRSLAQRIEAFDLGRELERVAARGVRMVFVFARGDAGLDLLEMLAGPTVQRLGEACRIRIIDGADHIFSQRGPRTTLEDILSSELFAAREGTRPRGATSDLATS